LKSEGELSRSTAVLISIEGEAPPARGRAALSASNSGRPSSLGAGTCRGRHGQQLVRVVSSGKIRCEWAVAAHGATASFHRYLERQESLRGQSIDLFDAPSRWHHANSSPPIRATVSVFTHAPLEAARRLDKTASPGRDQPVVNVLKRSRSTKRRPPCSCQATARKRDRLATAGPERCVSSGSGDRDREVANPPLYVLRRGHTGSIARGASRRPP